MLNSNNKSIRINRNKLINNFMHKIKGTISKLWNPFLQGLFIGNNILHGILHPMRWLLFNILLMSLYRQFLNLKSKNKFYIMIATFSKLLISTQLIIITLYQDINKSIGSAQSFGQNCNFKDTDVIFITNLTGLLKEEFWENRVILVNGLSDKLLLMHKA